MNQTEIKKIFADTIKITSLSVGLSIGYELKLFDRLIGFESPMTSKDIASKCKMKERYIREWLGLMATSGVISIKKLNETDCLYFLNSDQKKAFLESENALSFIRLVNTMLPHQQELMKCFDINGPRGIPFERYTETGMTKCLGEKLENKFSIESILNIINKVPNMNEKLTKGDVKVLEVGCSTGFFICKAAKHFSKSQFYGLDLFDTAIETAKKLSKDMKNVDFSVQDVLKTNYPSESFDYILAIDVVHDLPYPTKAIKEIQRILKNGGYFSVLDIDLHTNHFDNLKNPQAASLYAASMLHCVPQAYIYPDGEGLGATWGKEKAKSLFEECGFILVDQVVLQPEDMNLHYILQKQ